MGGRKGRGGRKGERRDAAKEERHGGDVEGLLAKFHVHCLDFRWQKNNNIWQILTFGGSVPTPFTDDGQIWCARADPRSTLHAKYHLNVLIVSASGGQKPQFWANF